jgi:hypothetical protein
MSNKKYKKYKNFLEKFLDSNAGKRFFNIAYNVGAAIVIFGAMAKILHWKFGDAMLMIGMITEIIVFLISAFERPSKDYKWEEVYPVLSENDNFVPRTERVSQPVQPPVRQSAATGPAIQSAAFPSTGSPAGRGAAASSNRQPAVAAGGGNAAVQGGGYSGGGAVVSGGSPAGGGSGTVIIGGSGTPSAGGTSSEGAQPAAATTGAGTPQGGSGIGGTIIIGGSGGGGASSAGASAGVVSGVSDEGVGKLVQMTENMEKFAKVTESLSKISDALQIIIGKSDSIGGNTQGFVTQMEALNRNIAGLNTIYEVQLKGISGQINTIEHINAGLERIKKLYDGSLADSSIFKTETEKMAQQLSELNRVYGRLLQAMTTNMNIGGGFNASGMGGNPAPEQR